MPRVYLDHNATTPVDPRVLAAVTDAMGWAGNASSIHAEGRRARGALETARDQVAALVGGDRFGVVFTSGGTEADFLGVVGLARASGRRKVVSSGLEHPAVRAALGVLAAEGVEVCDVAPGPDGRLDVERVTAALPGAGVLAVQLANHETGVTQDVTALSAAARDEGVRVHCDAVQAAGKMPVNVETLGVDTLALSGHKLGGPQGTGALWVRPGVELAAAAGSGHQERGRRPGTEAVAALVGLGVAASLGASERLDAMARVTELTQRLETGCIALGGLVWGRGAPRVGNTCSVRFEAAAGELVVASLDIEGVASSTGSACTSGSVEPSPVLLAMGASHEAARQTVRFSLGPGTTGDDVDRALLLLPAVVSRVRDA